MRIIAGHLGGRIFSSPHGHRTHPMSDKARGGLFNALGDVEGLTVLDAFAGSGALGFEAISRGAASALLIDNDKNACQAMTASVQSLGISKVKVVRAAASAWSDNNPSQLFGIVLLDPPYDNPQPNTLEKLARHVQPGGVVVLSLPPANDFVLPAKNYQPLAKKSYGDATLAFYRRIS